MSGSGGGGGGGYNYQADAFAFVSAHALAEQPLNWFEDAEDVPVAVPLFQYGVYAPEWRLTRRVCALSCLVPLSTR